jgi:hypothetical protein
MSETTLKCKNCGCPIDLFIGRDTKAKTYLHVIKLTKEDSTGHIWGWNAESKKFCRNPET